jgi:hypothetical protein
MKTIKFHTRLESDTPHLPQLQPMIGKEVEIIVVENPKANREGMERFVGSGGRDLVAPEAVNRLREISKI